MPSRVHRCQCGPGPSPTPSWARVSGYADGLEPSGLFYWESAWSEGGPPHTASTVGPGLTAVLDCRSCAGARPAPASRVARCPHPVPAAEATYGLHGPYQQDWPLVPLKPTLGCPPASLTTAPQHAPPPARPLCPERGRPACPRAAEDAGWWQLALLPPSACFITNSMTAAFTPQQFLLV